MDWNEPKPETLDKPTLQRLASLDGMPMPRSMVSVGLGAVAVRSVIVIIESAILYVVAFGALAVGVIVGAAIVGAVA